MSQMWKSSSEVWAQSDSADEEQLLREELGRATVSGTSAAVARQLPTDIWQATFVVPCDLATAGERCRRALSAGEGRLVGDWESPDGCVLRGIVHVGSTMWVHRPAIVTVWLVAISQTSVRTTIRAAAKEGLRKSHTAQRSGDFVVRFLGPDASLGSEAPLDRPQHER